MITAFNPIAIRIIEEEKAIPYELIHNTKNIQLKLTGVADCIFIVANTGDIPIYISESSDLPSIAITNVEKPPCKCRAADKSYNAETLVMEYGDSDEYKTISIDNATGISVDIRVTATSIIFYIVPTYDRFTLSHIVDDLVYIRFSPDNVLLSDTKAMIRVPHYVAGAPWAYEYHTICGWYIRSGKIYLVGANTESSPIRVKSYTMAQLLCEICEAAVKDPSILYYEFAYAIYTFDETATNNIIVQTALTNPCLHGTEVKKINLVVSDGDKKPYFALV